MKKFTLYIETPHEKKELVVENQLSVGRTGAANVTLADAGLSRVNTTFFRDGEMLFAADENSLNGTFVNGAKISGQPRRLYDGDTLKIGSGTRIRVAAASQESNLRSSKPAEIPVSGFQIPNSKPENRAFSNKRKITSGERLTADSAKPPPLLIAAAVSAFLIVFAALAALLIVNRSQSAATRNYKNAPKINTELAIPIRVIDPLGGGKVEDVADLVDVWDVQDKEVEAGDLQDVTASTGGENQPPGLDLKVSVAFWQTQKNLALGARSAPTGISPPGLVIAPEMQGTGVIKQRAKLTFMLQNGYRQPMDFPDLAMKRLDGELVELPMATDVYMIDVGGSASDAPFTEFSFDKGSTPLMPGSPKMNAIVKLAENFSGEKYDINNPAQRKQMRIRLLRMFHPRAEPILREIATAYKQKFGRPLRVTSLTRSMDYQIGLNQINPNSFKVRGAGSLPPHTSGCAFDLSRKQMTAEEQNFMMQKLGEMEREGKLDALVEGNVNACFHVFIYNDGIAPKI